MNTQFSYLLTNTATGTENSPSYSIALITLFSLGFIAATIIGSVAWYNSKRPVGWEDKERPNIVPEVDK
jgi:hypothetical protein